MYMDALTIAAVKAELDQTILGGRVQKALQSSPLSIGLEFYARGRRSYLLASAHPRLARVLLQEEKLTRDPQAQSPLLLHLRRRIQGAILEDIETPPLERILLLHFFHGKLPPEEQYNTLLIEVMGRHSNLIVVDQEGTVLDCIKRVTPQMSAARPMLPQQGYRPPPQQIKMDPRQATPENVGRALAGLDPRLPLWKALLNLYLGQSPLLAREIVQRACGRSEILLADLRETAPLADQLADFWRRPGETRWEPCLALEEGQPVACAPYPLTHRSDWQVHTTASISRALEQFFSFHEPLSGHQQMRQILLQAIEQQRLRLERQSAALQGELDKAGKIEELRRKGEWILAYQYKISPGQEVLYLQPDEIGLGEGQDSAERGIELDPRLGPVENAQSYFGAYQKAKLARATLPPRIAQTRQKLTWLDEITILLNQAETYDEISSIATDLEQAGLYTPRPGTPRQKKPLPPRTFHSQDGFTILVGRNARQNEALALRRAQPHDLWFHAQGRPGAHVIVVTGGRPVPTGTITTAAALAAYYSQGREEGRVAVNYTECRYVRRIPGGHPGQVRYNYERTVYVTPKRSTDEPGESYE